jgi:hypothetical protein
VVDATRSEAAAARPAVLGGTPDIAADAVGIELTELTCLSCGSSGICDVWQLSDWRR